MLVFDPIVSTKFPVIEGTWITVDHILKMIESGMSWLDIRRRYSILTDDNIREALAYQPTPEDS